MLCPYLQGECKTTSCRFWYGRANDCSLVLQGRVEADFYLDSQDDKSLGLVKVSGDLDRVLTKGLIQRLSRDPNFSDSDRLLIEKLVGEKERLESLKGFKR